MKPKTFDFEAAVKLENYVRRRYREQLGNGVLSFYFCAFQALERAGLGLCQPITATYPELAAAGCRNPSSLKIALLALKGVLCEVEIGKAIVNGKEATRLRRFTLNELQNDEPRRKLIDYAPADARKLAEILYSRTFVYGNELTCRPSWNVLKTGRVQSSKPNIQGHSPKKRAENLCAGLKPGQVLIYADFKQAEPTIIQKAIGYPFEADPYQTAADLLGINRSEAKKKVNALAYFHDSKASLRLWNCPQAEAVFLPFAEALTAYKEKLWTIGAPRNKKRRFVNTLTGRKIEADRGNAAHRGQILAWQTQGTVADVLNAACLRILELETSKGWKLCFPEHDACYVVGTPEQATEIGQIMKDEAERLTLPLTVKVETFTAGGVVCKSEQ